jgi:hypothetical protein
MARLNTKEITIKISKLHRDSEEDTELMNTDIIVQLEAIITELVGDGVIVEIEVDT